MVKKTSVSQNGTPKPAESHIINEFWGSEKKQGLGQGLIMEEEGDIQKNNMAQKAKLTEKCMSLQNKEEEGFRAIIVY